VLHRHGRVGDDHQAVDGLRERDAVAVGYRAAVRRQGHGHHALGAGLGDVRLRIDTLELEQPGGEDRDHHRDQDEPDPQPDQRGPAEPADSSATR
jgi:hypothetical protein